MQEHEIMKWLDEQFVIYDDYVKKIKVTLNMLDILCFKEYLKSRLIDLAVEKLKNGGTSK